MSPLLNSSKNSLGVKSQVCGALASFLVVAPTEAGAESIERRWDLTALAEPPTVYPAPELKAEGLRSFFYDGVSWQGKPTRVFAWYGAPPVEPGQKLPAMVLVHGGGGTAYADWVRLWNRRGYAAIAMDVCGSIPSGSYPSWQRHQFGGPPGWGGFDQIDWPAEDQWTYHAVADIIRAHSLVRSFPEVDAQRIGITGISWGGFLTCIIAGVDDRFRLAVPVYGCGFIGEDSAWLDQFAKMGADKAERWLQSWDPSRYLKNARIPMLWVTGSNDFAYPPNSWQKSYRLPRAARTICLKVRMPHGHGGAGENPAEIQAFADYHLNNGRPLARVTTQGRANDRVWATYESHARIVRAEVNFTRQTGEWPKRNWETAAGVVDEVAHQITAQLPATARAYYLNLIDEHGLTVSTEHDELAIQAPAPAGHAAGASATVRAPSGGSVNESIASKARR